MNKQQKKKILTLLLATSLSFSQMSCNRYSNNDFTAINELINSKESSDLQDSFFEYYINNFMKHMSKSQYTKFYSLINDSNMLEFIDPEYLVSSLTNVVYKKGEKGYGFYYALNARLVSELYETSKIIDDNLFKNINTINSLVENPDAFFSCLIKKDLDKLTDLISASTNYENKEIINELILEFDNYLLETDEINRNKAAKKITSILRDIIESKINHDEMFRESIYVSILKESSYFGNDSMYILPGLIDTSATIYLKDDQNEFMSFKITDGYKCPYTIATLKHLAVSNFIKDAFEKKDSKAFDLLSILLYPTKTLDNIEDTGDIEFELYDTLNSYFCSYSEFIDFLLGLFNSTSKSEEKFFEIFKTQIKENGIDITDFLRYQSIVNLYYSYESDFYIYNEHLDDYRKHEISILPKSSVSSLAEYKGQNLLFTNLDVEKQFTEIENILANNNLGISRIINKNVYIDWKNLPIKMLFIDETEVISKKVDVISKTVDGIKINYFIVPEYFNEGYLVDIYKTLNGSTMLQKISGLNGEITDPNTLEKKSVIVLSIDELEETKTLQFALPITDYQKNYDGKSKESQKILGKVN